MKKLITVCGIVSAAFLLFHCAFWQLFDWPARLQYMTPDHRRLMQTYNLCMLPLFAFSTCAFLTLRGSILDGRLGRGVLMMNAGVYVLRALAEPLFGDLRSGKSLFFLVLCAALGALFLLPLIWRPSEREGTVLERTAAGVEPGRESAGGGLP